MKRAVELDPNFAMAYTSLATSYYNLNQIDLSIAAIKKAFELRDRVTERERSHITTLYYDIATGEAEKATEGYKQWLQIYPRDANVRGNLADEYMIAGRYQDAVDSERAALSGDPNVVDYINLIASYVALNKFDEAQAAIKEGLARAEATGEHFCTAELHRLRARACLARDAGDVRLAEAALDAALAAARHQSSRLFELRAACDLARVRADRGERRNARDLLAPIYGWFTEGFKTADLKDAKALIGDLA